VAVFGEPPHFFVKKVEPKNVDVDDTHSGASRTVPYRRDINFDTRKKMIDPVRSLQRAQRIKNDLMSSKSLACFWPKFCTSQSQVKTADLKTR
jgi:hypothetical protein